MMAHETPQNDAALCSHQALTANKNLSTAELALMVKMHKAGKTQTQIAQALGCSQQNVSYHLQQLGSDTRELAEYVLDAGLYQDALRLRDITEKGNDDNAVKAIKLKWQARGVIQSGQQVTVNTAVMIAQPDKPETWGPLPQFTEAKAVDGVVAKVDEDHNS
jgi:predicted transcriptional regulator